MLTKIDQFFRPFIGFIRAKVTGGIILIFCVVISLLLANSRFGETYHHLLETPLGFPSFTKSLHFWVNDGLMAIFFLLVGLEIKRELLEGELASLKKSMLPVLAAIGGMLVPALVYVGFNKGTAGIQGWGIPMATDIAFAVAILGMLGNRVPLALKVFLTALAIVDDLGAIVVIAVFYTEQLALNYLLFAAVVFVVLLLLNRFKVNSLYIYLPLGIVLWYFTYRSGIHATISGVLLAFTIPTNPTDQISPLERLEHWLNKPVSYLIMPLFALSNTDIVFHSAAFEGLASPVGLGIICGLFIGKPLGIFIMSYISVKLKLTNLPSNTSWGHIIGAGFLGGIGFTMSIFIALLSFSDIGLQTISKISILTASVISAVAGYVLLLTRKKADETDVPTTVRI